MTATAPPTRATSGLLASVKPYLERAPIAALLLGISSGFPYAMIGATLTTRLAQAGIRVSLGHSGASFEIGQAAIAAGARAATHLFNRMYWVVPRLWKTELYSKKLATTHFWVSTVGLITYQVSMWVAGITQWGMWRAFEPYGRLVYPDFIETVIRIVPLYWVRLIAAILFFSGMLLLVWNIVKTIKSAPADYAVEPEVKAPPLVRDLSAPGAVTPANTYDHAFYRIQHELRHGIHRALEGRTVSFTVLTTLALAVGSLVEAIPMFFDRDNVKEIASVKPYTPLE